MAERIIGIDFGTSTSVVRVRRYQDDQPIDSIPKAVTFNNNGSTMVPTLIQKLKNGTASYYGYEAEVPKRAATLYQNFKLELECADAEKRSAAKELTADYLHYIGEAYRYQSNSGFLGEATDELKTIISYPVKWRQETRDFMVEAAKKAGFPNVEGLDEAQACIRAVTEQYAELLKMKGFFRDNQPCTILLIDMGAGTTDLCLCRHTPGQNSRTEILGTWPRGDEAHFGGHVIDELLFQYIASSFPEQQAVKRISLAAFKAWKESVVSPALMRGESVDYFASLEQIEMALGIDLLFDPIDRTVFEKLACDYLAQFPKMISDALADRGVDAKDVDLVILTGGHSQWYFVREMLTDSLRQFHAVGLGKIRKEPERIVSLERPQETVALGLVYKGKHSFAVQTDDTKKNDLTVAVQMPPAKKQISTLEEDDADAQFNLAQRYEEGQGVAQDHEKAFFWYTKAAEQGHAEAQYDLAIMYDEGIGIPQDSAKAIYWYTKAAERGHSEAQSYLGLIYHLGDKSPRDYTKAVYWYTKAAEQGDALGQCSLGKLYSEGKGVPQDYTEAAYWYTKAAEQGDADAQNKLGECYAQGRGIVQDSSKAIQWFIKAAAQGKPKVWYSFGKTVEGAIAEGLRIMGVAREHVDVIVERQPRHGFLGIGSIAAEVSITIKP